MAQLRGRAHDLQIRRGDRRRLARMQAPPPRFRERVLALAAAFGDHGARDQIAIARREIGRPCGRRDKQRVTRRQGHAREVARGIGGIVDPHAGWRGFFAQREVDRIDRGVDGRQHVRRDEPRFGLVMNAQHEARDEPDRAFAAA